MKASLVVRVTIGGKRRNLSPDQAKTLGLTGTYYMRTTEGGKDKWKSLGSDPALAKTAVMRRERNVPTGGGQTLQEAIDAFIQERSASQPENSVRRWKWELGVFKRSTPKTLLKDIDRSDVFAYWQYFKADNAAPRTIYNRIQSLLTFLKSRGVEGLLKQNEMPKYDEKPVDYYNETNPVELTLFFDACDELERMAFLFFLRTGAREREVMFATWADIDFTRKTFTVQPKPDLGFRTKNGKIRMVPIPKELVTALEAHRTNSKTRLIFVNQNTLGAEGHFLHKCKDIAFRAGLNCGHCVNKQGKSCATHPVCAHWTLHKFRRTWATSQLLAGTPITVLQHWIGHSDLETLNRYLGHIQAKSDLAGKMAEAAAKMMDIRGAVAAEAATEEVKV